jgi:hypothetical protein
MSCIAGNATRFRAVQSTAFVAPGTAAAADLDFRVHQLLGIAAPVLDLRQCSLQAAQMLQQQQQQQQLRIVHGQQHMADASMNNYNKDSNVMPAVEAATAALSLCPNGVLNSSSSADVPAAADSQLTAARQAWCQVRVAVQTALSAAAARKLSDAVAAAGGSTNMLSDRNSFREGKLSEDDQAEVLAALIQQLPDLAPQLQLLVLPVVLPGGR